MPPGSGRVASTLSAPPSSMPGARSKAHPPRMLCSSTSTWLPLYGIETVPPLTALNTNWSLDIASTGPDCNEWPASFRSVYRHRLFRRGDAEIEHQGLVRLHGGPQRTAY